MNYRIAHTHTQKMLNAPISTSIIQHRSACGQHSFAKDNYTECSKKRLMQRAANQNTVNVAPPIVHEVLRSSGQMLSSAARTQMETCFGHSFSHVRIHTDAKAAESAHAVNALAYTVGKNIVFGKGYGNIDAGTGRRLLAHELTHVIQQCSQKALSTSPGELEHPIPINSDNDFTEREARANELRARRKARIYGQTSGQRLQRSTFLENVSRFFGGGTFSDEELIEYLSFLDVNDCIEDEFDSDNKAREVVQRWQKGDSRYFLPVRRKVLLINEMLSGYTGDEDENAILAVLHGSSDTEIMIIIRDVGLDQLNLNFHGIQQRELDSLISNWRRRMGGEGEDDLEQQREAGDDFIERIVVDQQTTQTVTIQWKSGRTESDICSSGKGQCCVESTDAAAVACSESQSGRNGSNCTPVGEHRVQKLKEKSNSGIPLWTEIIGRPRYIALHPYTPVDGTPLSHGCIRLNLPMAQKIWHNSKEQVTKVEVKNLARPRCDYALLQREWITDFRLAGRAPGDGEPFDNRTQERVRKIRRKLQRRLGQSGEQLDITIANLRQRTGGLPTDISSSREQRAKTLSAVSPVAKIIPRCPSVDEE